MARFILALVAVVVMICLTSSSYAAPQENVVGKVFSLEGGNQEYFRQSISEGSVKAESLYGGDTAAAIAVLLGAPPPLLLSSASSSRVHQLDVACAELKSLPPTRPVYQKRMSLFFKSDFAKTISSQQKELDKARARLNKS